MNTKHLVVVASVVIGIAAPQSTNAQTAICKSSIQAYKLVRDIIQFDDLYRLENPGDSCCSAQCFVSRDRTRAVLFVFQIKEGRAAPVRLRGLIPESR